MSLLQACDVDEFDELLHDDQLETSLRPQPAGNMSEHDQTCAGMSPSGFLLHIHETF